MKFVKSLLLFFLYSKSPIILAMSFTRNCNFQRDHTMDNLVVQNVDAKNMDNVGECSKLCLENLSCVSFMFNKVRRLCIPLTENILLLNATEFENGWVFFNSSMQNVAFNRRAFQSSSYASDSFPEKAVDSTISTAFSTCASTHFESRPYWFVDLGIYYDIKRVEMVNRGDCCPERLHDVEVTVAGYNKDFNILCGIFVGPGYASQTVVLNCPKGTIGRYVKLQITKGTENILTVCNVHVIVR